MLLVLDIGNTENEIGIFRVREDGTATPELAAQWRISSQTSDMGC
jgi:pantothenate kinase type III